MGGQMDVWKFTPMFYRSLAFWGRCSNRHFCSILQHNNSIKPDFPITWSLKMWYAVITPIFFCKEKCKSRLSKLDRAIDNHTLKIALF